MTEERCAISDLPTYSCADCKHDTHGVRGRGLPMGAYDGLDELVDTREELGMPVQPVKATAFVVTADYNSQCKWDGCMKRIKVGDAIAQHPEHDDLGFVHAEHYSE